MNYLLKICAKCKIEKYIGDFKSNRHLHCNLCKYNKRIEENAKRVKRYYIQNESTLKSGASKRKEYYQKNREKILEYHKSTTELRNSRVREHRKNNPAARIVHSLRTRIHDVLKNVKEDKTNDLIGCSKQQLKKWLESQFKNDITWDNFAIIWQIDHVIPITFFDVSNKSQIRICFHWSNLRPLIKEQNSEKSNKIYLNDVINHYKNVIKFVTLNSEYQRIEEIQYLSGVEPNYGNNLKDNEEVLKLLLKLTIRNQASEETK